MPGRSWRSSYLAGRASMSKVLSLISELENARLWKGGHLIKGKKIIYDLNSGMISVDEARGVVQPGELKND